MNDRLTLTPEQIKKIGEVFGDEIVEVVGLTRDHRYGTAVPTYIVFVSSYADQKTMVIRADGTDAAENGGE